MNTLNEIKNLMSKIDNTYKQSINEGAWGVGPRQSDAYLDLQSLVIDDCRKVFKDYITGKKGQRGNEGADFSCIGLIDFIFEFFIKMNIVFVDEDKYLVDEYAKCIENCKKNEGWLSKWNHDADIQGSLDNLSKKLEIYKKLLDNPEREEENKLIKELEKLKDDKGLLDTIHDHMD